MFCLLVAYANRCDLQKMLHKENAKYIILKQNDLANKMQIKFVKLRLMPT